MKRKAAEPLTKHTLNLFEGQYERLQSFYPRVGAAYVIRALINQHIDELKEKAEQAVPAPAVTATIEDII